MTEKNDKSCCWSVTINNPTSDDTAQWSALVSIPWVKEVKGQLEQGEEGTVHLQGMVRTQSVRFAALKKALPRAHIEAARNQAALAKYVAKEDTRVGLVPTLKVATQADLQLKCLEVVLEDLKCSPQTSIEMIEFISEHSATLKRSWEFYLDKSVNILIMKGFYGVEFVVSNPQIRTAFRKYLPSILYRTYDARAQATQTTEGEASSTPPCSSQGISEAGGSDASPGGLA